MGTLGFRKELLLIPLMGFDKSPMEPMETLLAYFPRRHSFSSPEKRHRESLSFFGRSNILAAKLGRPGTECFWLPVHSLVWFLHRIRESLTMTHPYGRIWRLLKQDP